MKIAILDCDTLYDHLKEEYVSYSCMLERALRDALRQADPKAESDLTLTAYSAIDRQLPHSLSGYAGVLIMGSKFGAYDRECWIDELKAFIQREVAAGTRFAGICFGHQVIHQALGGQVKKSDKGWGVGVHEYRVYPPLQPVTPLGDLCGRAHLHFIVSHQDQVQVLAPGFHRLAGSEFCPNAITHCGHQVLTSQPHPEFVPDYARQLLNIRRACIGEERVQVAERSLTHALDSARLLVSLYRFFAYDAQALITERA